jgi:chemosensory pili system protein ChpA (sensor histidine kinase/response regulator)
MDVVSNEIRNLKGRLSIQTQLGQGTQFNIRLPLTLSVTQALIVSVQGQQYALPLGAVNAGERIRVKDIKTLLESEQPAYVHDNEEYDFIPLASLLDISLKLPEQDDAQLPLLLFRSGETRLAFLIDAVKGNREIVIKPIGKQLAHIRVLNGATILGDGRVIFILDLPTLTEVAREKRLNNDSDAETLAHDLERIQHRPLTAMVVDDSITVRKATSNLLVRLGFEVATAKDGVDALSQLQVAQPDIILLDVEMPRMDGFEFASMVRNNVEFRHLPIIMITSRTGEKHRERAKDIGVNAYLGKPFQEDLLVEHMKNLLGDRFTQGQA